jgi:hypothetical protein
VQVPLGADPITDGYSGTPLPTAGMQWRIYAERLSGAGTLDLDALVLVPADDRLGLVKWPDTLPSAGASLVLDGAASRIYALGSGGDVQAVQPAELAGALPMVTPGQAARVAWMLDAGITATAGDDKTLTTTITPYYWPRFLYVRGAA